MAKSGRQAPLVSGICDWGGELGGGFPVEGAASMAVSCHRQANEIFAVLLNPDVQLVAVGHAEKLAALTAAPCGPGTVRGSAGRTVIVRAKKARLGNTRLGHCSGIHCLLKWAHHPACGTSRKAVCAERRAASVGARATSNGVRTV